MDLKALQDKIVDLGGQMKAILDGVTGDNREHMNEDEEKRFDGLDGERKRFMATEERARLLEESEKHLAGSERRTQAGQPGSETRNNTRGTTRPKYNAQDSLEGLRTWLLAGSDE